MHRYKVAGEYLIGQLINVAVCHRSRGPKLYVAIICRELGGMIRCFKIYKANVVSAKVRGWGELMGSMIAASLFDEGAKPNTVGLL
jgi:hypothetical protein